MNSVAGASIKTVDADNFDDSMIMHMMHMTFFQSTELTILFKPLSSDGSIVRYIALLIFLFIICVISEGVNYHRYTMIKANGDRRIPIPLRIKITASYFATVTISYGIMLVVMSFNAGAFITIIAGLTLGNFTFGYVKKKRQINERKLAI